MSALLRRSSNMLGTLQKRGPNFTDHPVSQTRQFPRSQTQSRPYLGRFPNLPRKVRECSDLSPAMFSSSAGTTSSKVGLVGWYLGMVKSRPIVTKSVTCALIYTAADFSSQVMKKQLLETLRNMIERTLMEWKCI